MQRIVKRRMIEVIGLIGELEGPRIEQPHLLQRRPGISAVLDGGDIGGMRHFVEALGDVLSFRA